MSRSPRVATTAALACGLLAGAFAVTTAIGDSDRAPSLRKMVDEGRQIFRYETFGDEQLWTGVLRMHEVIAAVSPAVALQKGLKVDVEALPAELVALMQANMVDLNDPAVTVELIRLNAVVGVRGTVNGDGQLTSVGITCALCHSTVDDSFIAGIGKRLDGWANHDLDVGAIVALTPSTLIDDATRAQLNDWGPGFYDPRHHYFDGSALEPLNSPSIPVVLPSIFGLRNVGFETYNADGPISYWNSYVGVGQMGGQGNFSDPRLGIEIVQSPDLVTPRLAALLAYQLSLETPPAPPSADAAAAKRGARIFRTVAGCASCHQGSRFTDVRSGDDPTIPVLHDASETGMDPAYAERSATGAYRTTPLRALWRDRPFFHDGSAADLPAVVEHYDDYLSLGLTPQQKSDLVAYLKTI